MQFSRRTFLAGVSLAPLAVLLPDCASTPTRVGEWTVFTTHEAEVVVEATARLVPGPMDDPSEAGHPGAREANVVRYIDTLLGALGTSPERVYAGGPFSGRAGGRRDGMAQFVALDEPQRTAWAKRLAHLRQQYRAGLRGLDRSAGGDFTTLPPARMDTILTAGLSGFVGVLFQHTVEAMYAVPEYGGNRDLVGWHDIGFPGDVQPRGFTPDEVSQSDGPDR